MSSLLKIENLGKTFVLHRFAKSIQGCAGISLTLQGGQFIGITGKSGAGKSTILKCIYRTYIPTAGRIVFQSAQYGLIDLAQAAEREIIYLRKQEIGYVSQFLMVLPRVTALEMVTESIIETGLPPESARHEAKQILHHLQISQNLWDAYPNNFSGGEKLRLNLAQAMVKRPRLLLLDEPTASLDHQAKELVKKMIMQLKKQGTSMLGIFHDTDFMKNVIDDEFVMNQGIMHKSGVA
ncbi:MAG: phosphonate C-P lyase system protein PhnL [Bacillota bacterium]